MERLECSPTSPYVALEAAIHVGRYAPALAICAGKRVLDVACGEGYGSYLLATSGAAEVQGVDVSAEAVENARALFRNDRLTYRVGDAGSLDSIYPEKYFDLVVSLETIEHLADPGAFLRALRRVAKDEATIIISCPNDHWYYKGGGGNPYHLRKYTLDEFQELTTRELGGGAQWFFGTGALGFTSVPVHSPAAAAEAASKYVDVLRLQSAFICQPDPADPVSVGKSSYFMGVWGQGRGQLIGAAMYPMSMDRLGLSLATQSAKDALDRELEKSRGRDAELQRAQEDLRIATVQLNALRRENDIMASAIAPLKDAFGSTAQIAVKELKEQLRSAEDMAIKRWEIIEAQGNEICALRARVARFEALVAWVPRSLRHVAARFLLR